MNMVNSNLVYCRKENERFVYLLHTWEEASIYAFFSYTSNMGNQKGSVRTDNNAKDRRLRTGR
jgi:hypothetical protein